MTEHKVQVYSWKPFAAGIPFDLTVCTGKLTVEAQEKAVKKGKCPKGHPIKVVEHKTAPSGVKTRAPSSSSPKSTPRSSLP